jgi:hypothetical protein
MQQTSFALNGARSLAAVLGTLTSLMLAPDVSQGQQPRGAEHTPARVFPDVDRFGDPLPPGALARLGTERFRHRYPGHVVYSPDGKMLASITHLRFSDFEEQQYATLWDAATGKKLLHLPETDYLAFAPDNQSVAVVRGFELSKKFQAKVREGNPIRVLELPSGREKIRLPLEGARAQGPGSAMG